MLKDNQYDNKFVNQTRVIFNAANKVENEEKEHYNSDDELNDNDLKELNKYKNDLRSVTIFSPLSSNTWSLGFVSVSKSIL